MVFDNSAAEQYINTLYDMTGGDVSVQVSMYEVGQALGLEKDDAAAITEDLVIDGYVELVSLAGAISLTAAGLAALDRSEPASSDNVLTPLGLQACLNENERTIVHDVIENYKNELSGQSLDYAELEAIVIDIKTLELQMLSARPGTEVVRALLRVLATAGSDIGLLDAPRKLQQLVG